jgi:SAM-dependent methyltransferase
MAPSAAEWDERYRTAPPGEAEPCSIVRELLPLLSKGNALDIACGSGRHTLLLAAHGWTVTAVDHSRAGLDRLQAEARARRLAIEWADSARPSGRKRTPGITTVLADLERFDVPRNTFDLILCINYLQRPLFSQIEAALRPGGEVLVETYTRAQLQFGSGPKSPDYLLEPGELRSAFPRLQTVFYRELTAGKGIASILARRSR